MNNEQKNADKLYLEQLRKINIDRYFIKTYITDVDLVKSILENLDFLNYSLVLHNQNENNNHIHIVLLLNSRYKASTIAKMFCGYLDENNNEISCPHVERIKDLKACLDYLIHKNNPEKFQYKETDVFNYCEYNEQILSKFSSKSSVDNNIYIDIYDDMRNHISNRELLKKYGQAVVFCYKNIKEMIRDDKQYEYENQIQKYNETFKTFSYEQALFELDK